MKIMEVNRTNQRIILALTALTLLLLGACRGTGEDAPVLSEADQVLTQAAEIANTGMTQTAQAAPPTPTDFPTEEGPTATVTLIVPTQEGAIATPSVIPTNPLSGSQTPPAGGTPSATQTGATPTTQPSTLATTTRTPAPSPTKASSSANCNLAHFNGSENYPDGSPVKVGQKFTKWWRIQNTGTCKWTPGYEIIWVTALKNGEDVPETMGGQVAFFLTEADVSPGQTITVQITLTAPDEPGRYRLYYRLRSSAGEVFKVDGGDIWLEVQVNP